MTGTVLDVFWAMLAFVGLHFVMAHPPIRSAIVGKVGEGGFRVVYSAVSILTFIWAIAAYSAAPYSELWIEAGWERPLALALMLFAVFFFVCALSPANPALAGGEAMTKESVPGHGIFAVTRHPMLWAFGLWAICHMLTNGDAAAVIFFAGFAILSFGGMAHIDLKKRRLDPDRWRGIEANTSAIPFAALMSGKAAWANATIAWWRMLATIVAYAVILYLHVAVGGLSPLPV